MFSMLNIIFWLGPKKRGKGKKKKRKKEVKFVDLSYTMYSHAPCRLLGVCFCIAEFITTF